MHQTKKKKQRTNGTENICSLCLLIIIFSQNISFVYLTEPCSEAKKYICENSGCYFCHCLCFWFLQKWQFALQKRNKQYNIHESRNYINFLQIIRNSTKVIEKIRGMPLSLSYDTPSYVIMDYEKLYTYILLTQNGEIRAFEV